MSCAALIPRGMGVCPLEVASAPCSVADGAGQALERESSQSCGVMPLLHRPHMMGTSSSTQPHSVVSIAAVSFSLLGERGKANSPACRRTLGFMASTSPPPGRRWGSQHHLPSHWHAQGTVRVLFIPSILGKLLYHIPALRHRRIMNRGSHPAALGFTLDVSFHALLTPGLGGFMWAGDAFTPLPLGAAN